MVKQCGLGGFRRGATAEPFRAYAPYGIRPHIISYVANIEVFHIRFKGKRSEIEDRPGRLLVSY